MNRGSSLLITIIILSALLAAGVGIASIFLREIRLTVFVDDSIIAILAADAGIEKKLFDIRKLGGDDRTMYSTTLSNGAQYVTCPTANSCQQGVGNQKVEVEGSIGITTRALHVTGYK